MPKNPREIIQRMEQVNDRGSFQSILALLCHLTSHPPSSPRLRHMEGGRDPHHTCLAIWQSQQVSCVLPHNIVSLQ